MSCCCNLILQLCQVPVCGENNIVTGINAIAAGNHRLVLDYLDTQVTINQSILVGQPLNFPSANLNENYKYTGKIYGPDDQPISITVDEIVYDCITFKTVMNFNLNEPE